MPNSFNRTASGLLAHLLRPLLICVCLLAAALAVLAIAAAPAPRLAPPSRNLQQSAAAAPSSDRFDMQVRSDMFAGMAGDHDALDRAMKLCEQALTSDQKNAAALVWHGSGLVFQAGQMFRSGDYVSGKQVIIRGFKEMDDAVALAPDSLTTLIPRGASLLGYAQHSTDPERAKPRLLQGLSDYEKVLGIQKTQWGSIPAHSRGELLSGLVEGWLRAGDAAKARAYAQRIVDDLPGTRYAARAKDFLSASPAPAQIDWQCIGCHAGAGR